METNFTIYINGTPTLVLAKNKFHAKSRAAKANPGARVTIFPPLERTLVRIETCRRSNGRTFSVAVYSDGSTDDLD